MYEGVTALVSPEWERDVRDFFTSRGIVLGGKTLDQYLEQLHVAVRFQERESAALAACLARRAPRCSGRRCGSPIPYPHARGLRP